MSTQSALRRARQVIATVVNPHLSALLAGGAPTGDVRARQALSRFDWLSADGTVDRALVREALDAVELLLTDRAILEVGRVTDLPTDSVARRTLSTSIVRTVFDRLGSSRPVSERALNAALAMFVDDVALVRRDAVDAGVLTRSDDGAAYALVGGGPPCGS